jgi:hypothetical protein
MKVKIPHRETKIKEGGLSQVTPVPAAPDVSLSNVAAGK